MPYYFRCPECGKQIDRPVDSCPDCGTAFEGVACARCGHRGPSASFTIGVCPKCRAPVSPRSRWIGCLGLWLAFAVPALATLGWWVAQ